MRSFFTVLIVLTVAPITAVTALVCCAPQRWGGSLNPINIVAMAAFGLFTVPLWPTYVPAVALIPWLMKKVSSRDWFMRTPTWLVLVISSVAGVPLGLAVVSPLLLMSVGDNASVVNWAFAGGVSGGATLAAVALIHRSARLDAKRGAPANGERQFPPDNTVQAGGPPSMNGSVNCVPGGNPNRRS